jgi:hypothetical protein
VKGIKWVYQLPPLQDEPELSSDMRITNESLDLEYTVNSTSFGKMLTIIGNFPRPCCFGVAGRTPPKPTVALRSCIERFNHSQLESVPQSYPRTLEKEPLYQRGQPTVSRIYQNFWHGVQNIGSSRRLLALSIS